MAIDDLESRLGRLRIPEPEVVMFRDILDELRVAAGAPIDLPLFADFVSLTAGDFTLTDTSWDDLRFPLTGRNIDTTTGRIDYNYYNGSVTFAANARFNLSETISFIVQLPHAWKAGTNLKPHIHWIQQGSDMPNWTIGYKIYKKNTATTIETDFSNHTMLVPSGNAFTYTSGNLEQITKFPDIPGTGMELSDIVHICMWRDSDNDTGEHSGADPSSIAEHVREFDLHIEIDSLGSDEEFSES